MAGYNGWSMSNNAVQAYEDGEKPLSKWTKKTLVYALQQIQAGGIARTGQAAAVTVIVMAVPIIIFVLSQSQILETMASSGIKD